HTPVGTGLTRPILASDLAEIRELDASNRGISDLSGLEKLFNLETLNLANNNITRLTSGALGLVRLLRLTNLNLGGNRVADSALPALSPLTALRTLSLDGAAARNLAP